MQLDLRRVAQALTLATVAGAVALLAPESGAAPARHCGSFASQAAAQAYFVGLGGDPRTAIDHLDADRDGVACEGLPGPYKGFAGFGYNKRRNFFYGNAWMPAAEFEGERFACLHGNEHFPEGPRRLNVYRVAPGPDKPLHKRKFGVGAEANTRTGRLTWKIDAKHVRGRYYVAFEERIPLHPYGRNQCPGFHSRMIELPASRKQ
jgi:Excalibur calcium-binding domain